VDRLDFFNYAKYEYFPFSLVVFPAKDVSSTAQNDAILVLVTPSGRG
jgi:hypothetical protein